jgi:EAL domain-containing protein (putative c-di-GMP-specific phosphodiesterase class I)
MAFTRLRSEDLAHAIATDGLSLHYLLQVRLATGAIDGVECFVRWPHPAVGLVGPGEISDLLEQGGLHGAFDQWVVRTACAQLGAWRERGVTVPLASVSVWGATLGDRRAADGIVAAVRAAGAEPGQLEIKVPRGLLDHPTVGDLAAAGVRLATDEIPEGAAPGLRTIKVRLDTVREVDDRTRAIGKVVDAARRLGARVVADGVETQQQEDALRALGVDVAQGYLYSPEVSAEEIVSLVTSR